MNNRHFNSMMHFFNERWAAQALGMQVNSHKGPDLIDDKKIIELKFKVVYPDEYMHISWRVLEYQMDYDKNQGKREAYWGLGTYLLAKPISEIRLRDMRAIEALVIGRNITIAPWQWMEQFQPYHQKGRTSRSNWDNTIRFPKGRLLPNVIETYLVEGGEINLSEGVDSSAFRINI